MAALNDWDVTDANNNAAPPDGWPENTMQYSEVNNTGRAVQGTLRRFWGDINGSLAAGGVADAYTLTLNESGYTAYFAGMFFACEIMATNTGASTINVNGIGVQSIVLPDGSALPAGILDAGGIYEFRYDGTNFQLMGAIGGDVGVAQATISNSNLVDLVDTDVALRVGALDPDTATHIEISPNEIQAKADATNTNRLDINPLGGLVNLGAQSGSGSVVGYNDGAQAFATEAQGLSIQRGSGSSTLLDLEDAALNLEFRIISQGAGNVVQTAELAGRGIRLAGRNTGDTADHTGFEFDPDGSADAYFNNVLAMATTLNGADFFSTTGNPGILDLIAAAGEASNIGARADNGGIRMRVFAAGGAEINQTAANGTIEDTWLGFTRDGAVSFHNNNANVGRTQANGLQAGIASTDVSPTSGGAGQLQIPAAAYTGYIAADGTAMYIGHNSASRDVVLQRDETDRLTINATDLLFVGDLIDLDDSATSGLASIQARNSAGGFRVDTIATTANARIVQTNSSGTLEDIWIQMTRNGSVELRNNNVAAARTLAPASGGLEVDNQSTGAGFERVLTTSDLTSGGTTTLVKDGSDSATNDTTLSLDSDLQFSAADNTRIMWEAMLICFSSNTTPNIKFDFGGPSIGDAVCIWNAENLSNSLLNSESGGFGSGGGQTGNNVVDLDANVEKVIWASGYFETASAANAGIRFAQDVSSANPTSLLEGSWLRYSTEAI